MSPVNPRVLGAAAVVVSPALWLALVAGTLPLQDALTRYLIAVPLCWAALNLVAEFFFPSRARTPDAQEGDVDAATVALASVSTESGRA